MIGSISPDFFFRFGDLLLENSIPKQLVEEKIKEIRKVRNSASELIGNEVVIAGNGSFIQRKSNSTRL